MNKDLTTPPFPDKMTFRSILDNMFDFSGILNENEIQSIADAGEMYANGCLHQALNVTIPKGANDVINTKDAE